MKTNSKEEKSSTLKYRVYGKQALFASPFMRTGGSKTTYSIPTYEALRGITEAIYWKPTINYIIDSVRIVNEIDKFSKGVNTRKYKSNKNGQTFYQYLSNVCYEVNVHFEMNAKHLELLKDYNILKHEAIFNRSLMRGGRNRIFLGTSECFAYVEPIETPMKGYYDNMNMTFDPQFHSFEYPSDLPTPSLARFWTPRMENGIIKFIRPEECQDIVNIKLVKATSNEVKLCDVDSEAENYGI